MTPSEFQTKSQSANKKLSKSFAESFLLHIFATDLLAKLADYSLAWLNSGKIYKGQKSKSRQSDASLYKGRGLCFRLSRPKGFPEPAKRE